MLKNNKEGWLAKESRKSKQWKKRWFVLNKTQLYYYQSPQTNLLGAIDISETTKIEFSKKERYLFEITIPNDKTYRLLSETQDYFSRWVDLIYQANPKISIHRYTIEDFTTIDNLGKGTFGKVSLVQCKQSGKLYAMKTMNKKILEDYDQVQAIIHERNILFEIDHPFIVSAHYSFQTEDKVHLILDYVSGGNLLERKLI